MYVTNMSRVMDNLSNNNFVQCASVYMCLNQENTDALVVHCSFCTDKFSEWPNFYRHLEDHHLLLKSCESDYKFTNDEKEIGIKIEYLDEEFFQSDLNKNLKEFNIKTEYLDNEKQEPLMGTELLLESSKVGKEQCQKENIKSGLEKTSKPIKNCFFRLCATDTSIMFKFIELLRDEPCQWNYKYNFSNKEKRLESTLNLTKKLNKLFNLNITPQSTRNSVLILMRWFENEYIRLLNCQENNYEFVCTHKEYFDKLFEFLPHEHLRPMNCDQCFKRFKSEHLLMAHKHKHHNGQVPFRCRFCGHGFIHQSSHKMHENRHTKLHVWPCNNCVYQAVSKSDYIKHLNTHSPKQPYKCSFCGLAYKTKTNLNVHMKSHGLPEYKCEICQKQFYEKYRYKRHMWEHEETELSHKSMDNFTCELCGRRFTSRNTLAKHQLVHVQENYKVVSQLEENSKEMDLIVYFCDYCSLEFFYEEAYETHMSLKHKANFQD